MFVQAVGQSEIGWDTPVSRESSTPVVANKPVSKAGYSDTFWEAVCKVFDAVYQFFASLAATLFPCCATRNEQLPPIKATTKSIEVPDSSPKTLSELLFENSLPPVLENIVTEYLDLTDLSVLAQHPSVKLKCTEAFHAFQNALKYIPSCSFEVPKLNGLLFDSIEFGNELDEKQQTERCALALEAIRKLRPLDVNAEIIYRDGMMTANSNLLLHAIENNQNDKNRLALVKALMQKGADPRVTGFYYQTIRPIEKARELPRTPENIELTKLLENFLATHPPLPPPPPAT